MATCPWWGLQASTHQVLNKCLLSRECVQVSAGQVGCVFEAGAAFTWSGIGLHLDLSLLVPQGTGCPPHPPVALLQGAAPAQVMVGYRLLLNRLGAGPAHEHFLRATQVS